MNNSYDVTNPTAPQAPVGVPLKKLKYLQKEASAPSRIMYKIALGIGAFCLILIFLAANNVINGKFSAIPLIDMVLDDAELEDFEEKTDELVEALDDAIDDADEDLLEEFEDEFGVSVKKLRKMVDTLSINDIKKLGANFSDDKVFLTTISAIITFVIMYALVLAAITFLGILLGKGGFMILALVVSLPFHIFLSGTAFLILNAIACIAFTVLVSRLNREYKKYKKSFKV